MNFTDIVNAFDCLQLEDVKHLLDTRKISQNTIGIILYQ